MSIYIIYILMYSTKAACHRLLMHSWVLSTFLHKSSSYTLFLNTAAVWGELPFTGRGRRAWNRGCPACRAAIQRCRARRWPCPSKRPARSRTPPRTGGPRCWRDTPGWRLLVSCWEMCLQRGRQSQD